MKALEDECGRTVDVMRFLLVYGLDLATASSDSQALCNKLVKESVRNLMKEMVELSDKEFSSRTLNETSGLPPSGLDKKSTGFEMPRAQRNVLMKQGDWLCPKYFPYKVLILLNIKYDCMYLLSDVCPHFLHPFG